MSLLAKYESIIASGLIRRDPQQVRVLSQLQLLCDKQRQSSSTKLRWQQFFRKTNITNEGRQGMYLYGGVGSGKTMLMDLFYDNCPEPAKRRVHYNAFMLNVHSKLHALKLKSTNPVKILADDISRETKVLCLDEFQVVDVADAMLLRNLLEMLISRDLQFVITSNRHPSELYLNGIQRQSFLPCIELLEKRLEVVRLTGEDYRRKDAQDEIRIFQWPINDDTTKRLKVIFHRLCKGRKVISQTISTHGRSIEIEKSAGDVAMFSFEELCSQPRSAADYLSIASRFKTIVLEKVPIMDFTHRDEARRFITMIDVFYDNKIRLVLQSNAPPEKLFELGRESCLTLQSERSLADELSLTDKDLERSSLVSGAEEIFATHRTISRLTEMQHLSWWTLGEGDCQLFR